MATQKKKTPVKKNSSSLHYDKDALLKDYEQTFSIMVKAVGAVVALALIYFFVMAVYLGGWSHTKHDPFVERFGDRVEIDYDGLKTPIYGEATSSEYYEKKATTTDHHE